MKPQTLFAFSLDSVSIGRQLRRWWALFLLAGGGAALVSMAYLALVSQAALRGREIETLRAEIAETQARTLVLQAEYASQTAYDVMAARAAALGYRKAALQDSLYVPVDGYLPPGPQIPSSLAVQFQASGGFDAAYTQSLIDWVLEYLREVER